MPRGPVRHLSLLLTIGLVVGYLGLVLRPAWQDTVTAKHARDYATYHYATQEALAGGDPYDTKALDRRARDEKTRKSVHPYFYPPPFLLTMVWANGLSLEAGYRLYFWLNQAALALVLLVCRRWFQAPLLVLAFVLATFTPIPDNARMGQANLLVLGLAMLGLWRSSGTLVSLAAMMKMSPALYLAQWIAERRIRPVLVAVAGAFAWSLLSLPLARWPVQLEFYTDVLPGFSTGQYHGLTVPISLPANHSVADLLNRAWPGKNDHVLSETARLANAALSLILVILVGWCSRRRRDALGSALFAGAFTVILVVTPIYTYEHHLVFLLLPLIALGAAFARGLLPRWTLAFAVPIYACVSWPLPWIRAASAAAPEWTRGFYETKFIGMVGLGVLCVIAGLRSPTSPAEARS